VSKYSTVGLWPSEREMIQRFWHPGGRILDLGCGAGRTTVPLRQAGYQVVGVDIAQPMVSQAKLFAENMDLDFPMAVGDATDLPLDTNCLDGILFSYNGIELIPKQSGKISALREAYRVLKPGGTLIFTTHAFEAFNKYAPARLQRYGIHVFNRMLGRAKEDAELGEVIVDPKRTVEVYYMQINSPRRYRKLLTQLGFSLVYYNSRKRIESGKSPTRLADFDGDFKFYVAQKET